MSTISEMLTSNATVYPRDVALIEVKPSERMRKQVTWKELDERANMVANVLVDRGIRKGDKVIHWMMNSINWVEAYFGIIRTGAWAVPLNYRFTSSEFKYCADIAEAKAMIVGEEFVERVDAVRFQLPVINDYIVVGQNAPEDVDGFEAVVGKASSEAPGVKLGSDDGCGLYFTSGTTGAPKPIL
ncbi:MAG: acyl--CoA ligase, partial [Chloroflexi bacterium]|nr:acyl--CoA ligase [Chloroflexota bacterium]